MCMSTVRLVAICTPHTVRSSSSRVTTRPRFWQRKRSSSNSRRVISTGRPSRTTSCEARLIHIGPIFDALGGDELATPPLDAPDPYVQLRRHVGHEDEVVEPVGAVEALERFHGDPRDDRRLRELGYAAQVIERIARGAEIVERLDEHRRRRKLAERRVPRRVEGCTLHATSEVAQGRAAPLRALQLAGIADDEDSTSRGPTFRRPSTTGATPPAQRAPGTR